MLVRQFARLMQSHSADKPLANTALKWTVGVVAMGAAVTGLIKNPLPESDIKEAIDMDRMRHHIGPMRGPRS